MLGFKKPSQKKLSNGKCHEVARKQPPQPQYSPVYMDNDMSDNSKVSEGEWKNYNNSEQCALNRHALFRRLRSALD